MFKEFVEFYESRFPKDYILEEVLHFGIKAWNLATMEQFLPPGESLPEAYNVMPEPERTIMKQMLRKKASTYGKYDRFIVDFDSVNSTNSRPSIKTSV